MTQGAASQRARPRPTGRPGRWQSEIAETGGTACPTPTPTTRAPGQAGRTHARKTGSGRGQGDSRRAYPSLQPCRGHATPLEPPPLWKTQWGNVSLARFHPSAPGHPAQTVPRGGGGAGGPPVSSRASGTATTRHGSPSGRRRRGRRGGGCTPWLRPAGGREGGGPVSRGGPVGWTTVSEGGWLGSVSWPPFGRRLEPRRIQRQHEPSASQMWVGLKTNQSQDQET